MRIIKYILTISVFISAFISCIKYEPVPKELIEQKFTIISSLSPNDTLKLELTTTTSAFDIIEDSVLTHSMANMLVNYSINGQEYKKMIFEKGFFYSDAVLKEGDIVVIEVEDPDGLIPSVRCESMILPPPEYKIENLYSSVNREISDPDNILKQVTSTDYKIILKDDANTSDYYMLCVNGLRDNHVWDFNPTQPNVNPLINRNIIITPKSEMFMDMNISISLYGYEKGYINVFDDSSFNGNEFEFPLNIKTGEQFEGFNLDSYDGKFLDLYKDFDEGNGYFYYDNITKGQSDNTSIFISKISRDTYLYHKSLLYYLSNKESDGIFREPNYLYSNIDGGAGIVGSIAPGKIYNFTKSGKTVDTVLTMRQNETELLNVRDLDITGKWHISEFSDMNYYVDSAPTDSIPLENSDLHIYFRNAYKISPWDISLDKRTNALFSVPQYIVYKTGKSEKDYGINCSIENKDQLSISVGYPGVYKWDENRPARCSITLTDEKGTEKTIMIIYY